MVVPPYNYTELRLPTARIDLSAYRLDELVLICPIATSFPHVFTLLAIRLANFGWHDKWIN
jgi:hypothetical protein